MNPIVTIKIKDLGEIKIELYPEVAKNTVNNFINYINEGFYNGLIFHRVIPSFMIQGGGSLVGTKSPIKGEFNNNGFKNDLKHTKGVISMARTMDPNSATSQFFIMHKDSPHLDDSYAGFGKVISGDDIVDKIARVARDGMDKPRVDVVIEKVSVDLNGYEVGDVVYFV